MATCTGHIINNDATGWRAGQARTAALHAHGANHAERAAYNQLAQSACYLMLIDDFPCDTCHAHFLAESLAGRSIIFKVTANRGAYSAHHGLGQRTSVPCIIYYHGGTARYESLGLHMAGAADLGPHGAFPAHPAFTNI